MSQSAFMTTLSHNDQSCTWPQQLWDIPSEIRYSPDSQTTYKGPPCGVQAPGGGEEFDCESIDYRKNAMTLLYETKFSALFEDLRGQTKFEASGVESVNDTYFTIFDR